MRLVALSVLVLFSTPAIAEEYNPYVNQMVQQKQRDMETQRMQMMQYIQHRQQNPEAFLKNIQEMNQSISFNAGPDGHVYVPVSVNNSDVNFLADTGASRIFLTQEDAKKAGINTSTLNYNLQFQTANGVAYAAETTVKKFSVGPINFDNMPVTISKDQGGMSLLGMTFFRQLNKYTFENGQLTLYK